MSEKDTKSMEVHQLKELWGGGMKRGRRSDQSASGVGLFLGLIDLERLKHTSTNHGYADNALKSNSLRNTSYHGLIYWKICIYSIKKYHKTPYSHQVSEYFNILPYSHVQVHFVNTRDFQ